MYKQKTNINGLNEYTSIYRIVLIYLQGNPEGAEWLYCQYVFPEKTLYFSKDSKDQKWMPPTFHGCEHPMVSSRLLFWDKKIYSLSVIGSMHCLCKPTFTVQIKRMQVNIPYMDPLGFIKTLYILNGFGLPSVDLPFPVKLVRFLPAKVLGNCFSFFTSWRRVFDVYVTPPKKVPKKHVGNMTIPKDPCMVYLHTNRLMFMVHVGKYTSPMDPMGIKLWMHRNAKWYNIYIQMFIHIYLCSLLALVHTGNLTFLKA